MIAMPSPPFYFAINYTISNQKKTGTQLRACFLLGRVTDLDAIRYKKAAENLRATVIFALSAPIDLGLLLLHVL